VVSSAHVTPSGTSGTGTSGTETAGASKFTDEDVAKIKSALSEVKIPAADQDKIIELAQDAKEKPEGLLKFIEDPIKKEKMEPKDALKALTDYLEEIKKATMTFAPAPARIIVSIPAKATLTVDGEPTRSTSSVRTFETPNLAPSKTFSYILKADFVRDGRSISVSKKVEVRAGKTSRIDFNKSEGITLASR
jgi:uncharacterized protein (TIGR03000 family)